MSEEALVAIATVLGPVAGAATAPGETPSYFEDPEYQKIAREWAEQYGEEYPEFPGMPEQLDTMGTRLEEMLGGELSPAVQQYLGYKYNQAWQSGLTHLADIGAGPGTLASVQQQLGVQQAIQGAYMGQEQIAKGMEYMPQYTQMMLSPYMADVTEWKNVADLIQQNFPGVTPPGTTPTVPTAPTTGAPGGGPYTSPKFPGVEFPWVPDPARFKRTTY